MNVKLLVPILVVAGAAGAPAAEPFVCRMSALGPAERERHAELTKTLMTSVQGSTELPDGYAIAIDPEGISLTEMAEWIGNESRCCPFLDFGLDVLRDGGRRLRLTGPPGVKEFLAAELPGLREEPTPR